MNEEEVKELIKELKNLMKLMESVKTETNGLIINITCYNVRLLLDYIEQLQNNWNELKKWLEDNQKDATWSDIFIKIILEKMQELEQGKDESN